MGNGTKVDVEIIRGVEGLCVAVNGTRIAGAKPWGGGKVVESWEVDAEDVRETLPAAAPREVEEVREALRKVVADWRTRASARPQAHDPAITMDEAARWVIASTLRVCADDVEEAARLSSSSGEAPERGDGEGRP